MTASIAWITSFGLGMYRDAVVRQGRALLAPLGKRARPDQAQLVDVVPVDLVERAVAPAVPACDATSASRRAPGARAWRR